MLRGSFLIVARNGRDDDLAERRLLSFAVDERLAARAKSWEGVFDARPFESSWFSVGCDVQATFWELRKEEVLSARRVGGRP